jgi:hypothetical protein
MKPRNVVILVIVLVAAFAWTISLYRETHLRKIRDAQHQVILNSYSNELKPGMTRSEVEDLLHQKNMPFSRVRFGASGLDDLVTIGREDSTVVCTHNEMDMRLHFTSSYTQPDLKGFPTDKLEYVKLLEQGQCL